MSRQLMRLSALLILAACSPDESRVELSIQPDPPLSTADIRVTFEDGLRRWHVDVDGPLSFSGAPERSSLSTFSAGPYNTRTNGTLKVSFVATRDGDTISTGSVELPLRPDWEWGVTLRAQRGDPATGCLGCVGIQAFPIAESFQQQGMSESIYLVWGGNSIKNPVVY